MRRTSWILGSMTAFLVAACGGGSAGGDADMGGAETGSGMAADTVPAGGAMDTALTDTTTMTTDTATN